MLEGVSIYILRYKGYQDPNRTKLMALMNQGSLSSLTGTNETPKEEWHRVISDSMKSQYQIAWFWTTAFTVQSTTCDNILSLSIHLLSTHCFAPIIRILLITIPERSGIFIFSRKCEEKSHSLEQCLNSKRRWEPRNLSMGIGNLIISPQRGLLLW
jgi:hypothetical protein